MKNKHIVKDGRVIIGFVWQDKDDDSVFWYAFGKPSQSSYIAWECSSIEKGIELIKENNNKLKETRL